jgi:hypothetical protein
VSERCSAYEGCQQGCEVRLKVFFVGTSSPVQRAVDSGQARRAGATEFLTPVRVAPGRYRVTDSPRLARIGATRGVRPEISSSVFPLGSLPGFVCVSFHHRGRRVVSVDRIASRTSSYPSSSARERPLCRACLTAATGGSAPSNRRAGAACTHSASREAHWGQGSALPAAATSSRRPVANSLTLWLQEN